MEKNVYNMPRADISWCPGCGNYMILKSLKDALIELDITPENLVMVSGVGGASKIPHYMKANVFNGLHGRILPPACGIKAANPELVVIAAGGDGDIYGEGGNHLLHAIRRNSDITSIVHNNLMYALTKNQASPTSFKDTVTTTQPLGVTEEPFNPVAMAVSLGATFVARAFCLDTEQTKEIIKKAVLHKGYALIDIIMPCLIYEKMHTFSWTKENTYYLESDFKPHDRIESFKRSLETEKLPLGIFYIQEGKPTFEQQQAIYKNDKTPVVFREISRGKPLNEFLCRFTG